jgi:4'-phosphopantetheinyl transferase
MTRFDVPNGEVHVWWASLEVSDSEIDELRGILSSDEQRRADRFRIESAAHRFIAARAALRTVLGRAAGLKPARIEFAYGENGKPSLADDGPCFNASDSGDFVAIAVTSTEVGIDIELTRTFRRSEGIARRICTKHEIDALAKLPEDERDARLLRLWTCKEAALKALGTGLPGGVRNIEVEFPATGSPRLVRLMDEADGWTLLLADLFPDLLCSIVVKAESRRVVSRKFSLQST